MQELLRGASTAFALKILAAGLGFGLNVVLARLLGAEGTGLYFLALTVMSIGAVLGRVGLDNAMIRFIAANSAVGNWVAVKGVYVKSIKIALAASGLVAITIAMIAPWLAETVFSEPELASLLRWVALAVVPFALFSLHALALQGLKKIRDAILVLSVWAPFLSLLGIFPLVPMVGVIGAVWAYICATFFTLLISIWRWKKSTPQLKHVQGHFETKELIQSSMPLFCIAALNLILTWSSTLILGVHASSEEVGIFGVANRTAMLASFVLAAVNSIAAPKFAALYKQGDMKSLGETARNSAKIMTLMASPILLLFLLAPRVVLQAFGEQFVEGSVALLILVIGQFINVSTGSVGYLLMMCGRERLMRNNLVLCAGVNIVLGLLFIPQMGITGAATATAVALSLQNVIAAGFVWKKMGLITIPMIK